MFRFLNLSVLIFTLMLCGGSAYGYVESPFLERTKNYNLKEQLENDPHRLIPKGEKYSAAADFNIWKYWEDTDSYYHGPGYWVDTYFEYKLFDDLAINLKSIFANGTSSAGYNRGTFFRANLGVTWAPKILPGDWNFMLRFFDLDRNTVGAGLFLQDREMSGLLTQVDNGTYFLKWRLPGTSVLQRPGDLWSLELYRESSVNRVGLSSFIIDDYQEYLPDPDDPNEIIYVIRDLAPVTSLFFTSREDSRELLMYGLQVATIGKEWAGMASLGLKKLKECKFCFSFFGQYRFYQDGIIDNLAGNVDYEFIPYSMQDRQFHNAHNIFFKKDDVQSYSAHLNFKFNLTSHWNFESMTEAGVFDYKTTKDEPFFFTTQRFGYCPYDALEKYCLYFYYSNKIINARSVDRRQYNTKPILYPVDVVGLYGVFYL